MMSSPMKPPRRTKKILVEMPIDMAEALRIHAIFERTSMSAIVRRALTEHLGEIIENVRRP